MLGDSNEYYDFEFLNSDGTINTENRMDITNTTENANWYMLKRFKLLSKNSILCTESHVSGWTTVFLRIVGFNTY